MQVARSSQWQKVLFLVKCALQSLMFFPARAVWGFIIGTFVLLILRRRLDFFRVFPGELQAPFIFKVFRDCSSQGDMWGGGAVAGNFKGDFVAERVQNCR